jgi:hypothetical protein
MIEKEMNLNILYFFYNDALKQNSENYLNKIFFHPGY